MPRTVLDPAHTAPCELLPDRNTLLDRLPKDGFVAEIGVAFGDFTHEILGRSAPRSLHLIDAWSSERYRAGLERIKEKWKEEISKKMIRISQGSSTEILSEFPPSTFDWVYIDTNHTFETTLLELQLCAKCVKPGGYIAGHDFCTGNVIDAVPYGVVEAVQKFCRDNDWGFRYLTLDPVGHFSFCLKALQDTA